MSVKQMFEDEPESLKAFKFFGKLCCYVKNVNKIGF